MLFKNALAYSGTNIFSQVILFIRDLFLRRILPPAVMGAWNFVQVARGFVAPFSIGLLSGTLRELPILKGRKDPESQGRVRAVALTYSLAEVAIVSLFVVGYALLKRDQVTTDEYFALLLTAVLLLFARFQEIYTTLFQGDQLYVPLAKILLVNSIIHAILLPLGAWVMGLWGVFLAALAAESIKAAWGAIQARRARILPDFGWDLDVFRRLASYSIPYRISTYPFTLFTMVDVLWITRFADLGTLAIYAMAKSFFLQGSEITIRFGTVLMTRMFEQYGEGRDSVAIGEDLYRFILIQLLVAIPLVCWAVMTGAPFLIRQVTPLYSSGIQPLSILLVGAFFDMRNNNLTTIWLAQKKLVSYGAANAFSLIGMVGSISVAWFVFEIRSLPGLAAATVVGYVLNFLYLMITVGRETFGAARLVRLLCLTGFGAVWMSVLLVTLGRIEPLELSLMADVTFTLRYSARLLLMTLPVILVGLKVSGAGAYLLEGIRGWRKGH